jgi:hypothetical protein
LISSGVRSNVVLKPTNPTNALGEPKSTSFFYRIVISSNEIDSILFTEKDFELERHEILMRESLNERNNKEAYL